MERFTDHVGESSPIPESIEKGEVEEKGWRRMMVHAIAIEK